MRFLFCCFLFLFTHTLAHAAESDSTPWFRDAGEWISTRSTRQGTMADYNTKLVTDGKRFDASVGKRIPLYNWNEASRSEAWSLGIEGGMLASLRRFSNNGGINFATNTFDGFFGAYIGYSGSGWLALFHTAHLSAHLVDSESHFLSPVSYTHFWNEVIVGKSFLDPEIISDWDIYVQGSIGINNTSTPSAHNPLHKEGLSAGYALFGPNTLAILASFDASHAGMRGQRTTYSEFVGIGYLTRPNNTHRPFRAGVSHYHGSDFRNEFYYQRQNFTAMELQLEF